MPSQRIRRIVTKDEELYEYDTNREKITETDELITVKINHEDGSISRKHIAKKDIKEDYEYDYHYGMCYITTACVEAANQPDDCLELETLRYFRDNFVANSPNGKKLIEDYKQISPKIVESIKKKPNSHKIFSDIFENDIEEAVSLINNGKYEDALSLYVNMTNRLKNEYLLT